MPDFAVFALNGQGYAPRFCHDETFNVYTPGFSLGNAAGLAGAGGSPQGWQLTMFRQFSGNIYAQGIKGENRVYNIFAPGDFNLNDEVHAAAGMTAPSDEGVELHRSTVAQLLNDVLGTAAFAPAPSTIVMNCTSGCGSQGSGRYVIEGIPMYSGTGTVTAYPNGYTPGVITLATPLNALPSSAVGMLLTACIVPQTSANTGGTCTVSVQASAGTFVAGSYAAAAGAFHNQLYIVAVSGDRLTLLAHHSIPVGAMLFQGQPRGDAKTSCTGLMMELPSNTIGGVKLPFEVFGCADTTHLLVGQYIHGVIQFDLGNVPYRTPSAVNVYRGAEALDVRNAAGVVDGTLIVEPNQMQVSGPVEVTQLVAQAFVIEQQHMIVTNPYFAEQSSARRMNFSGCFGNGYGQVNGCAANADTSETPLKFLRGYGGTRAAPLHDNLYGVWSFARQLQFAPQYGLDYVGCPADLKLPDGSSIGGCSDPGFSYAVHVLQGDKYGALSERWTPSTDTYTITVQGGGKSSTLTISPDGFTLDKPLKAPTAPAAP